MQRISPQKQAALAAVIFAVVAITLQWWRLMSLNASYDQGIFFQILWNGLSGHPFESTLSSQLSTNVIHSGEFPALGYQRLSQHFTPILVTWIPLIGLLGIWGLPIIQVGMITAAGIVLYKLAALDLSPSLSAKITFSFYFANAVIAPTLANFTDLCQLPLLVFALLYGLRTHNKLLTLICTVLIPLVREDTGVVLAGIALWLGVKQPQRRPLATAMFLVGVSWVVIVTNVLMPMFGDDNARRFMVSNFGQFAPGVDRATSLDILGQVLRQPITLLRELVSPPGDTLLYLAGQGLPLLFIPLIATDAWLMMGFPLLGLLLAKGSNDPLSINIRYTFLVVPGLFGGSIYWWQSREKIFASKRFRQIWTGCMVLSLLFAIAGNQNRSFSFLIPDSIQPWLYNNPVQQWKHGQSARASIKEIPPQASVSANTNLVPWLANRSVLVRFPHSINFQNETGIQKSVDWIAVDLKDLSHFSSAFPRDRKMLNKSLSTLQKNRSIYSVYSINDGVVLMQRHKSQSKELEKELDQLIINLSAQNDARQ